jgi:hypothetical protein
VSQCCCLTLGIYSLSHLLRVVTAHSVSAVIALGVGALGEVYITRSVSVLLPLPVHVVSQLSEVSLPLRRSSSLSSFCHHHPPILSLDPVGSVNISPHFNPYFKTLSILVFICLKCHHADLVCALVGCSPGTFTMCILFRPTVCGSPSPCMATSYASETQSAWQPSAPEKPQLFHLFCISQFHHAT